MLGAGRGLVRALSSRAAAGGGGGAAGGGVGSKESPLKALLQDAGQFAEAEAGEQELHWATQPYAQRPGQEQRPPRDPRDHAVLLFPGQGAQRPGMAKPLLKVPAAREVLELASHVYGLDIGRLCSDGTAQELGERSAEAVAATSLAAAAALRDERPGAAERVAAVAGFSLGELLALAWAGAYSPERALRLVGVRAAAQRAAAKQRAGGMLTLWLEPSARLGALLAEARDAVRSQQLPAPVLDVANYLYADCRVVAGDEAALRWLEAEGRARGVKRAKRVAGVCVAFHSALMAPAADVVKEALTHIDIQPPRVPVMSALDGRWYGDAKDVRRRLAKHPVAPVRWEQTLHALFARPRGVAQPLALLLEPAEAIALTLRRVNARAYDCSVRIPRAPPRDAAQQQAP